MEKNKFLVKVSNTVNWLDSMYLYVDCPSPMSVSFWVKKGNYMYDDELEYLFPELCEIGLEEPAEGEMMYVGDEPITLEEMIEKLRDLGFDSEIFYGDKF